MNPAHLANLRARLAAAMAAPTHATDYAPAPDLYEPESGMPEHLVPVAMPTTGTHCMRGEICKVRHNLRGEHLVPEEPSTTAPYPPTAMWGSFWASFEGTTR